jgi:uncharacterized protein YybS (DUF2232 family)
MTYQPGSDPLRRPDGYAPASPRIVIDVPRLWSGGAATAVVAALVAWVGVLIGQSLLDRNLSGAAVILSPFKTLTANYAFTAALLAVAATGLAHLLSLSTPRPTVFFGWIVGLFTVAGVIIPFTREGDMYDKATVAIINLVLGICVGSLLSAVMARTVVDRGPDAR